VSEKRDGLRLRTLFLGIFKGYRGNEQFILLVKYKAPNEERRLCHPSGELSSNHNHHGKFIIFAM
jgi:hypothetical protein